MKPKLVSTLLLVLFVCWPTTAGIDDSRIKSFAGSAKGEGTITVSDNESHKITSVVINLREDGNAEFTFVSEIQLFAKGKWSAPSDLSKGISLKITGGVVEGDATGTGKLFLLPDGKTIDKLNIDALGPRNGAKNRKVTVVFVAEK
jgi:hypothetical protein